MNKLFDQLLVNLKIREEQNIIPPKFVFPYVLSDAKGLLTGYPFDASKTNNALYGDFTDKVAALNSLDDKRKMELP